MADFVTYGDTDGALGDRTRAGDQAIERIFTNPDVEQVRVFGDADTLRDRAEGGDTVRLVIGVNLELVGDARSLAGRSLGGDDTIVGNQGGSNALYGDGVAMTDRARGGNDVLDAPGAPFIRTAASSDVYGDAYSLADRTAGGDDLLRGAIGFEGSTARLYGDGHDLLDGAAGGNDTLVSVGFNADDMWGDAAFVGPNATTGADTFVFAPGNGRDIVHDFEPGKDRIDFSAFTPLGLDDFETLSGLLRPQPDGTLIVLDLGTGTGAGNSVLVLGAQDLSAADFVFG